MYWQLLRTLSLVTFLWRCKATVAKKGGGIKSAFTGSTAFVSLVRLRSAADYLSTIVCCRYLIGSLLTATAITRKKTTAWRRLTKHRIISTSSSRVSSIAFILWRCYATFSSSRCGFVRQSITRCIALRRINQPTRTLDDWISVKFTHAHHVLMHSPLWII